MAASIKRQVDAARKAYDKTVDAVFKLAPNMNTKFTDCLALAGDELREKLETAYSKVICLECDAVSAGKAYRGTFGSLIWYR